MKQILSTMFSGLALRPRPKLGHVFARVVQAGNGPAASRNHNPEQRCKQ